MPERATVAGAGEPASDFIHADGLLPGLVASAVGYVAGMPAQGIHRGLPSPFLPFIVTLNAPVIGGASVQEALGPDASRMDVVAAGLHTSPTYIVQSAGQVGIQLAIHPLAARRILGVPAAELTQRSYDGVDVIGAEVSRLRERLAGERHWPPRLRIMRDFLQRQVASTERIPAPRPEAIEAWRWLLRYRGRGEIAALADHVQLSHRRLQSVFTEEFGIGPKRVNRLIRFHRAVRMLAERTTGSRPLDLASIALACGYYDQAHLNRDFREFTGLAPTAWVTEERANIVAGGHRNGDALD